MSAASYLAGTLDFALIVGPALAAAWITTRRSFSYLGGAEAALAFALVATAALLAVVVVTGALGVLGRVSAVIAAFALLGLARAAPLSQEAADEKRSSRGGPILWGLAAAAVAIVLVYAVAFLVDRRTDAIVGIDVLNFGLPGVARWIQQGQIWSVGHFSVYW
ncbi:MAG: hypothetical protein QOJ29_2251, partial [Thermoleophilaceae bacterium]|nr:hypothetical protein [Thermoleophilaceae bacterium]